MSGMEGLAGNSNGCRRNAAHENEKRTNAQAERNHIKGKKGKEERKATQAERNHSPH